MTGSTRIFVLLASIFALGGCGFSPMYAPQDQQTQVQLSAVFETIEVGAISDRLGQIVRNGLIDRLAPSGAAGAAEFLLDVSLTPTREGFGFRSDESITRENFRLDARFQLVEIATGKTIFEGTARANMAYDVVQSDFSNFVAFEDAERRTAGEVVQTITARLGLYFRSKDE